MLHNGYILHCFI